MPKPTSKPKARKPKAVKAKKTGSARTPLKAVDLKTAYTEFFGADDRTGTAKDMYS